MLKAISRVAASAAATFALMLAAASPALAQGERTVMRVATEDLNLSHPDGQAQLERRIRNAARVVCGGALPLDGEEAKAANRCRKQALLGAETRVRSVIASAGATMPTAAVGSP